MYKYIKNSIDNSKDNYELYKFLQDLMYELDENELFYDDEIKEYIRFKIMQNDQVINLIRSEGVDDENVIQEYNNISSIYIKILNKEEL